MVFVKVRETYDLHTTKNKMSVIAIHAPKPDIIKRNYPGLLMQTRAYRPVSADVRVACASVLPLDPKGVGLTENDVAPEDIFNPILYKAMSNKGMSQLEARINGIIHAGSNFDVDGSSAAVEVDSFTPEADEFDVYYGLLANSQGWKHANPQAGLEMKGLKPLVYEMVYSVGDSVNGNGNGAVPDFAAPSADGMKTTWKPFGIMGKSKPMPFLNTTSYSLAANKYVGLAQAGFADIPSNCEVDVPYINVVVGCIIVPPSRLHELFYRMVVEWTIEFSMIRPLGEILDWGGLKINGQNTHYQNYSFEAAKAALDPDGEEILDKDTCMVSANVDINKVM